MLGGDDLDLLSPLRFLRPGEMPRGFPSGHDRDELAEALTRWNADLDHPRAKELGERLGDPATRVVVTGQQPGLYGGPLLALTKMIAAVRWAETLTDRGQPAVAVFWVATEDHDWKESTRAAFLTRKGPKSYDLGEDRAPLHPLGNRTFGEDLDALSRQVEDELGSDLAAAGFRQGATMYRQGAGFGDAFCRLMIGLLGDRAPLFLDSMDVSVKRLQGPFLRRLVERRQKIDEALVAGSVEVEERGYSRQVGHSAGAAPLFLLTDDGERRRILWDGDDGYKLRGALGERFAVDDLLRIVDEHPERLSPSALARPAIQDGLLGTTLQVMGPSEISYLTQAGGVYWVLEVEPPCTTLRPQVLFLETKQAEHLDELGVSLAEVLRAESIDQLLADRLGEDFIEPAKKRLEAVLDALKGPVLDVDPTLERPFEKTRDQVGRALDQLGGKVASAIARRHDVWRQRLHQIVDACLPDGHLQERHFSVANYLARYDKAFVDIYFEELELDPRRLQVFEIAPFGGDA